MKDFLSEHLNDLCVFSYNKTLEMAKFFKSYFTQSEFKKLYKKLLPELDSCSNCGIVDTCKACKNFINSHKFFYLNTTKDQWDYVCNFLQDVSNTSEISRQFFVDIRKIPRELDKVIFYISNKNDNNAIMFAQNKNKMCYISGVKKYKYFENEKKPIIHEFFRQGEEKKLEK